MFTVQEAEIFCEELGDIIKRENEAGGVNGGR